MFFEIAFIKKNYNTRVRNWTLKKKNILNKRGKEIEI